MIRIIASFLLLSCVAVAQEYESLIIKRDDNGRRAVLLDTLVPIDSVFWDDLVGTASMGKTLGTGGAVWNDDSATLVFSASADQAAEFVFQVPHSIIRGAAYTIRPHIHWIQTSADTVAWRVSYAVSVIGAHTVPWTESATSTGQAIIYTAGAIHQISELPRIATTAVGLSTIIRVRLSRDVSEDDHAAAHVMAIDLHVPTDGRGSKSEYSRE